MPAIERVAVIGGGVIGASWTALFASAGYAVAVHDPAQGAEDSVRAYAARAWPTLRELGLARTSEPQGIRFCASLEESVDGAGFVQESVPERLDLKHEIFRRIEPLLTPEAIVASSASGLMVREMQAGWHDPSRFLLGHPFNPPHLIPLVELLGNELTDPEATADADSFYESCGKVTIRVRREVPGHVANRLQAALWREAIALAESGVASVEDIDKAICAGPGLRWAAMGPHMLFHLGAGNGGIGEFCKRYADSFHRWWNSMDDIHLTDAAIGRLTQGIREEQGARGADELMAERDALILAILKATRPLR